MEEGKTSFGNYVRAADGTGRVIIIDYDIDGIEEDNLVKVFGEDAYITMKEGIHRPGECDAAMRQIGKHATEMIKCPKCGNIIGASNENTETYVCSRCEIIVSFKSVGHSSENDDDVPW